MKIAVTGPNGQLGSELVRQGAIPLEGLLMTLKMTDNIKTIEPDAIINCAAITDVDYCERHVNRSAYVNAGSVDYLSDIFGGYLIQISTDYVFDGKSGPYGVRDTPNPIGVYGWSKLGGELSVHRHQGPSLIIRTTILFSGTKNNFVAKVAKQLKDGLTVNMYSPKMTGSPTYIPALVTEIIRMVNAGYIGLAHLAGSPIATRLEFARQIANAFNYDPARIVPNYDPLPLAAPRPMKAGLICDHSGHKTVYSHNWIDGLLELSKQKEIYT